MKIMCKMFEVVTGKKSKGSVDKLEGLTKMYTDINEEIAIIKIPVELMEVDSRYQTDERTERDLQYLVRNWDERKLINSTKEASLIFCIWNIVDPVIDWFVRYIIFMDITSFVIKIDSIPTTVCKFVSNDNNLFIKRNLFNNF